MSDKKQQQQRKVTECNCCQFLTSCKEYAMACHDKRDLCDICACTFLSNEYYYDQNRIARSLGYIANMLLQRIDKLEQKIDTLQKKLSDEKEKKK